MLDGGRLRGLLTGDLHPCPLTSYARPDRPDHQIGGGGDSCGH